MDKRIIKLLIASFSLFLIGAAFAPITAQADNTATSSEDPSPGLATKQTFKTLESPYVLVTDGTSAPTKVYWYPQADTQIYTAADFQEFPKGVTNADVPDFTSTMMKRLSKPFPLFLNDSLARYCYENIFPSGVTDGKSYAEFYSSEMYLLSWLIKIGAEQKLGTFNFTAAKHDYDTTFHRLLVNHPDNFVGVIDQLDAIFASNDDKDGFIPYLALIPKAHLDQLTIKQLARLDPVATAAQNKKLIEKPVSDYIHGNGDQAQADGAFFVDNQPLAVVLSPEQSVAHATSHPVTVHYVDEQGNALKSDKTLTGSLGDNYQAEPLSIDGYQLVKTTGDGSGKFTSSDQSVTYTYRKAAANIVVKDSVVYATKKIGLYASPKFSKQALLTTYAEKSRMNRPMFKVIGTATSKNGVKHYKVKDLNGKGTTGYITTKSSYVTPLYYAKKQKRVTVINANGLNSYTKSNLTGKAAHYKQGQVLKIKQIIHHNLTTRFVLNNGKYISANKKLVIAGKYKMPKRVQAKTAINRYGTANLTKKNKHFAKKSTFTIKGWAYSNTNNFRKGDTLRYKVAGGYITGNSRFIKTFR